MTARHLLWRFGQSNSVGAAAGASGSNLATVPLWKDEVGVTVTPVLGSLLGSASGGVGADYSIGRALLADGWHPIICNISRGSTYLSQWKPGGTFYSQFVTSITNAWAAAKAANPNDSFTHHHVSDIGEEDARYGYPSPSGAQIAITNALVADWALVHAVLEGIIGTTAQRWVIATNYTLAGTNDIALFRSMQLAAAVVGTSDARRLVTRDETDGFVYPGGTGLHLSGGDGGGYDLLGQKFARIFAQVVAEQSSLSSYTRDAKLNHLNNKVTHSPAATHYLHLYADVGLSTPLTSGTATGYAPASNTNNTTTWPNASGRTKSNGVAFTFPTPGGTWPDVCGWKLTNSPTEGVGNVLASGSHAATPVSVALGALSYPIGAISITAATGALSDTVAHGLLNLIFGAVSYTQLTTAYGNHWAGDPQGAGSQAGSRVAMTQASLWGSSSGGVAVSAAAVSLTQQVTGTYWAEHDASSAGTLLRSATRPAPIGASGVISVGQLKTQIL